MSKTINVSPADLADLVTQLLVKQRHEVYSHETYQAFMTDIAKVVCKHFGGEVRDPADNPASVWFIPIHANDKLPSIGESVWQSLGLQSETAPAAGSGHQCDPNTMDPPWSDFHCAQAQMQGWDIFETQGSDGGPWQLQRLDDASEIKGATQLETDAAAWQHVLEGTAPVHEAARRFLQVHNPKEYEWALRSFHPLKHINGTGRLRKPAGFTFGGFTVGHRATMVGCNVAGLIIDLLPKGDKASIVLQFDSPQPVDAPQDATSTVFELPPTSITSTCRQLG
jgi:hypothetical protein